MATPFTAFSLSFADEAAFLDHWASRYTYPDVERYDPHIGRPLTQKRLWNLFYWKNGGPISDKKQASIRRNYPVPPPAEPAAIYLDPDRPGGAIWNIFYLHCIDPQRWPIYDQHAHRAMIWIQDRRIDELPTNQTRASKKRIYDLYQERYIPFLDQHFTDRDRRRIDRALFTYGRFLKRLKPYCCTLPAGPGRRAVRGLAPMYLLPACTKWGTHQALWRQRQSRQSGSGT